MMSMNISGGTLNITDDNNVTVSQEIADEINKEYIQPDNADNKKPEFTIQG